MQSQEQLIESIINAISLLEPDNPASSKLASYLYIADKRLSDYLDNLDKYIQLTEPTPKQRYFELKQKTT